MNVLEIVRAWKDATYRATFSAQEQAFLSEHPAGSIELTEEEENLIGGGQVRRTARPTFPGGFHPPLTIDCKWVSIK